VSEIYKQLSAERKAAQAAGDAPEWLTTGGYQLLKQKYLDGQTVRERYAEIAKTAAKHRPVDKAMWEKKFFELLWKGYLAASTPVLTNMGRPHKGMPVSCTGNYIPDSIAGFYDSYAEIATLTKNGFGTSSYLGAIRPRGEPISSGGKASGVIDVITSIVDDMRKVSQGTSRRGAWAGYYPLNGGDFYEVADYLLNFPDDLNIGWNIYDRDIELLKAGDKDMSDRFARMLKVKLVTGKGYLFFPDKATRANPCPTMGNVLASNLCSEIMLPSDENMSFTCVLSSMNLAMYDEWKDTDAVEVAIVFLDCVASEFIELAKGVKNFERTVAFTEHYRALGLGALGFHTYLQKNNVPYGSVRSMLLNNSIFSKISMQAKKSSEKLAREMGTPVGCINICRRNSHLLAVAPNTSSALICGGVSQGIEPVVANLYNQMSAAGDIYRVNPVFLELAKSRGKFTDELVKELGEVTDGSVQHLEWLTPHEKEVFKTAYELDQKSLIRMAAARQRFICQGQSLNLFADADEDEEVILEWFKLICLSENIKAAYYLRTKAGVKGAKSGEDSECVACEG